MRLTSTLAMLGMAACIGVNGIPSANARSHRGGERHAQSSAAGTPRLAVIALAQQRISIYGNSGKILEAPVSTGAAGRETPAGIYSILQKEEEHRSNLYDDASMPYMERLTWTGIAMHAGALPGYAASHGCTRLPYGFAQQLYELTGLGMRVVIVREDIAPAEIEQPAMFTQPHASGSIGPANRSGMARAAQVYCRDEIGGGAGRRRSANWKRGLPLHIKLPRPDLRSDRWRRRRPVLPGTELEAAGYVQEAADTSGRKEKLEAARAGRCKH